MIRRCIIALAATTAAVAAAPAHARAVTELTLSVVAEAGWARAVTLRCAPPDGGHPAAASACATLYGVDGDPSRLRPTATACTMEYAPVTASLDGMWRGRAVTWSTTAPNECDLHRTTRGLFDF